MDTDSDTEGLEEVASPLQPEPFRFMDLPAELRLRIYQLLLVRSDPVDLDPENSIAIASALKLFRACRQIHNEAYPVFYGRNTFRVFSTNYRFFTTGRHLISRLPPRYRKCISSLELRFGPGWTNPPKSWSVMKHRGLQNCTNVRTLKVFIELDPTQHDIFCQFLPSENSYSRFCVNLFHKVVSKLPSIRTIEFDAWESIRKDGNLMVALLTDARSTGKKITYGPEHGWTVSGVATPANSYEGDVQRGLITGGLVSTLAAAMMPVALLQA